MYGKHILFALGFFLVCQCSNAQQNRLRLSVIQGSTESEIKGDTQTIKLTRQKFTLQFNSLPYTDKVSNATQIDAFFDPKGIGMIHPGMKIEDISYFAPGSGLACDKDKQYECLYIDADFSIQHYIIYDDVNKDRRAKLESRNGDTLRLSWNIDKISLDRRKEISIKKIELKPLYIVVLNDFNMNGIVDAGEYSILKIIFE